MGGSEVGEDWEMPITATTLVLVGRTGNGKSATGNSILGQRSFESKCRSASVTSTCEVKSTTRSDGRCIRVVDTPGLFDPRESPDFIMEEIIKCLELAKDGVHALLLVLSARMRFTVEEMEAVESLQTIFGDKVVNYMIVVFTGGDDLEDNGETLDDYLSAAVPDFLNELIRKCGNRKVLFDNKSKDKVKKEQQISELMSMVDDMVARNGGSPYTSDIFKEAQELAIREKGSELKPAGGLYNEDFEMMKTIMEQSYKQQLDQLRVMVEEKLRLSAERFEEKFLKEQRAREEVERRALIDKEKSEKDIRDLKEELERANREREEFREQMRNHQNKCTIL